MTQLAPVVLFCYKRLDTLIQTVEALKKNFLAPDSELYVFSDAAKNDVDKIEVDKVRSYVNAIEGFKSLTVYEATENMGLANSIIQGVSKIFLDHEKIVVLEDDLVTSANFLNFMNEGLIRFNASPSVFSISGYSFNLNKKCI
jgi:GT2 family glycosyltransferase